MVWFFFLLFAPLLVLRGGAAILWAINNPTVENAIFHVHRFHTIKPEKYWIPTINVVAIQLLWMATVALACVVWRMLGQ